MKEELRKQREGEIEIGEKPKAKSNRRLSYMHVISEGSH